MAIDWDEVNEALEAHALDDGTLDADLVDAVLLKDMYDRATAVGRLPADSLNNSIYLKWGSGRYEWPWQNPEALKILADEPGFDLQTLLDNLPTTI